MVKRKINPRTKLLICHTFRVEVKLKIERLICTRSTFSCSLHNEQRVVLIPQWLRSCTMKLADV